MAGTIRELIIKLGLDSKEFERNIDGAKSKLQNFTQSGSEIGKLVGGIGLLTTAAAAAAKGFYELADSGREFNELSGAFKALGNSSADLERLRKSTQGLVSDIELFKTANLAAQLGLTKDQFDQLAQSADALGDAVGIDTAQSLELLTRALGAGNERMLKQLGITIDSEKAEKAFAAAIGHSGEKLNERGKLLAFQNEALARVAEKTRNVSSESVSLADNMQSLAISAKNAFKEFAGWVDNSPNVIAAFKAFRTGILSVQDALTGSSRVADDFKGISDAQKNLNRLSEAAAEVQAKILEFNSASTLKQTVLGGSESLDRWQNELSALEGKQKAALQTLFQERERLRQQSETSVIPVEQKVRDSLIDTGESAKKAASDFAQFQKTITGQDLERTANQLEGTFDRIFSSIGKSTSSTFGSNLSAGASQFNTSLEALKENVRKKTLEGYDAAFRNSPEAERAANLAAEDAATAMRQKFGDAVADTAITLGDKMKEQIASAASFATDAFYNIFTGQSFNFEDMFKRLAAGVLGGVVGSLVPELGNFSNLQDFGTKIGGEIIKGILGTAGDGGGLLQSISSTVAGQAGGGGLLGNLLGGAGGAGLGSILGAPTAGLLAGGALAAGTAVFVINNARDNFDSGKIAGGSAALAIDSIFPGVGTALDKVGLGKLFGGAGKGKRESAARSNFLDSLKDLLGDDLSFQGVRGDISLRDASYNFKNGRTSQTGNAIAATSGLGSILGGGDAKLSEDIQNMLADAVDSGKNFNEVLIQTQSLMEGLNISAPDLKKQLTDLFLDGKISLDKFNEGLNSAHILEMDNLQGIGNVGDAMNILGDETTTTRAKLKGLGFAFIEMKEIGIDTTAEIHDYMLQKYGPEAAAIFDRLAAAGIDSFEDIKNASAEQIAAIFNILNGFKEEYQSAFIDSGAAASDAIEHTTTKLAASLTKSTELVKKWSFEAKSNFKSVAEAFVSAGLGLPVADVSGGTKNPAKFDPNPKNFKFAQ